MQRVRLENGAKSLLSSPFIYLRHVRYRNVITFAPLGVVLGCMKIPNGTALFQNRSNFCGDIPILHFAPLCTEY